MKQITSLVVDGQSYALSDPTRLPQPEAPVTGALLQVKAVEDGTVTQVGTVSPASLGAVKTVNGIAPDEKGNVEVSVDLSGINERMNDLEAAMAQESEDRSMLYNELYNMVSVLGERLDALEGAAPPGGDVEAVYITLCRVDDGAYFSGAAREAAAQAAMAGVLYCTDTDGNDVMIHFEDDVFTAECNGEVYSEMGGNLWFSD